MDLNVQYLAEAFGSKMGLLDFQNHRIAQQPKPFPTYPLPSLDECLDHAGILYLKGGPGPKYMQSRMHYTMCSDLCCLDELKCVHVSEVPDTSAMSHSMFAYDFPRLPSAVAALPAPAPPPKNEVASPLTRCSNMLCDDPFFKSFCDHDHSGAIPKSPPTPPPLPKKKVAAPTKQTRPSPRKSPIKDLGSPEGVKVPCYNWNEGRCIQTMPGVVCPQVPDGRSVKYHVCRNCLGSHKFNDKACRHHSLASSLPSTSVTSNVFASTSTVKKHNTPSKKVVGKTKIKRKTSKRSRRR